MAAVLKYWTGSAWVAKPLKVWNGSAWVSKSLKYWNGSAWVGPAAGGAAPAFRSSTFTSYIARNDTIITKPSGVVTDDILIASMVYARSPAAGSDLVIPSGWAQIGTYTVVNAGGTFGKMGIWWKRAGGSEPADYTWAQFEFASTQGFMAAYSGCIASGSPVDVLSQNSANTGTTATGTGVTTTAANRMLLYLGHNWDGTGTLSPPSGMTERADGVLYSADQVIAAAGATGNRTQTLTTSNPWAAFMVALKGA